MKDLIREHLNLLSNTTGIGFIFTNQGIHITSCVYRNLDIITELKSSKFVEEETYSNIYTNTSITYRIYRNPINTRVLYIFPIGESSGSEYVVETDVISESIFQKHKETVCRTILIIRRIFELFEKLSNLEIENLNTNKSSVNVLKGENSLTVLKTARLIYKSFYVGKLSILNHKEIFNIYGNKALQHVKTELNRLLSLYKSHLNPINNKDALHLIDDESYLLFTENKDTLLEVVNKIADNFANFKFNDYVISVKLGISYANYPMISDTNLLNRVLNAGVDSLRNDSTDNLTIVDMNSEAGNKVLTDVKMSEELRHALTDKKNEIVVVYQPKVSALTGRIIGAEGLIRWNHSKRGLVPPTEFITLSERTGIIKELGKLVFDTIVEHSTILQELTGKFIRLGVNVSTVQLEDNIFVDYVESRVNKRICNPALIDIEVTESVGAYDISHVIKLLSRLSSLGITISLDDFGTGYSSLTYMKNLPINSLKIDKSFIDSMFEETSFCKNIIEISKKLNLETVAEGVETEEQWIKLREFGCDVLQGYLFSKPVKFPDLVNLVKKDYNIR